MADDKLKTGPESPVLDHPGGGPAGDAQAVTKPPVPEEVEGPAAGTGPAPQPEQSVIPGMGKALKNVEISDDVFKQTEAIINSMTPLEREKPEIIDAKRRERLAKGSGTTMAEVNKLMKQFEDTHKMMKAVAGGNMKMPKLPGRGFRR